MKRRVLSMLLVLVMLLMLFPMTAGASEITGTCGTDAVYSFDPETGVLTISGTGSFGCYLYGLCFAAETDDIHQHDESGKIPRVDWGDQIKTLIIEDGITGVCEYTFQGCSELSSVRFPQNSFTIFGAAFSKTGLTEVELTDEIVCVHGNHFAGCTDLKNVKLNNQFPTYGMFSGCTALESIVIPVAYLSSDMFAGCTGLKTIWFEGDLLFIGETDFTGVSATAYYPADNETWTEDKLLDYGGDITWVSYDPEASSHNIVRLSGKTRYETAFSIANQLKENLNIEKFETVVVAYGQNFPDALTGSYLAAVKDAPILLTEKSADARVLDYIQTNLVPGGTVYILGGTAAVTQEFEDGANERGFTVKRLKDKNRYGTNLKILEEAGVNQTDEILIATGTNYADSLSASATGLPMLLVGGSLTEDQIAFLKNTSGKFVIIGGTGAVNEAVEAELAQIGTVERIKGKTRYETSVVIAERYFTDPAAAVLAYAQGFPDGLCGGPLAMNMGAPLILTSNEAPTAADDYIEGITVGAVTGGTGRITDDTVRAIFDLADDTEIPVQ